MIDPNLTPIDFQITALFVNAALLMALGLIMGCANKTDRARNKSTMRTQLQVLAPLA